MRRVLIIFALFIWLISACAPESAATQDPSDVVDEPTSIPAPTEPSPEKDPPSALENAVIEQLAANLGLPEGDIRVVSSEKAEFGDACLGVAMEGVMCAQVVTPGHIVVLEADGLPYEYHVSEDGSHVQPATLALVWKREGGIAGFCDTLTVFRSGEVFASKCKGQDEGAMGIFADLLTPKEQQQFFDWVTAFAEEKLDASDPTGVADRMVVTVDFYGTGSKSLTASDQQVLFNFAQDLYQELP